MSESSENVTVRAGEEEALLFEGTGLTSGDLSTKSSGISNRLLFLRVVPDQGILRAHLKSRSKNKCLQIETYLQKRQTNKYFHISPYGESVPCQ